MKNKTALITGASRGIGRAVARRFAEGGYDLAVTCRENTHLLKELRAELTAEYGIHCLLFTGDLSDDEMIRSSACCLAEEELRDWGLEWGGARA